MSASPLQLVPPQYLGISRRQRLWLMQDKKCHWCHNPTRLSNDHAWDTATIDHVIPRYKGGVHEESNMVSACNRCNNRRNHEDISKLPEGALLGQYKNGQSVPSPNAGKKQSNHNPPHVALTRDEKKAILAKHGAISTMEEQRNGALKEIAKLREELGKVHSEGHLYRITMNDKDSEIASLKEKIAMMTVMGIVRTRIATWLLR